MSLLRLIVGRPLSNRESEEHKVGVTAGVPAMGLDAISSSAYGPEAALAVLVPLGAAGLGFIRPITLAIVALLVVLYVSYRQTVRAYPFNGGAYTVSMDNLGLGAGVLAATSLMIDYVLNVAVGISAGVGALVSALPVLHPYTLWLCLGILAVITLANLRGTAEAGLLFALPTYLYLASFGAVLVLGIAKAAAAGGHPAAETSPPPLSAATELAGIWIVLRSFASGCTAMTGVEAVSNGVGAFCEPRVSNAQRTLSAIVGALVFMLLAIAYLARAYGIGAMDETKPGYRSVLSQLAGAVIGIGPFYYVVLGSLLAVLVLSANTSFVGFPRLCGLVAQDDLLPRSFAIIGRRLVYSVGVLYLAGAAGLLLLVFGGITDRLIPLFAVGAFLAFTLSQTGMAAHWLRELRAGEGKSGRARAALRLRLLINAGGAAVTAAALGIIMAAKFLEGAWITVVIVPLAILLLMVIRRYYRWLDANLRSEGPIRLSRDAPPIVLVPTDSRNSLADKAVRFALRLSPEVIAVHLTALSGPEIDEHEQALRESWARQVEAPARAAGLPPPRLVLLRSPYRKFVEPLLKLIEELREAHRGRTIAVLIPELVPQHWWQYLLHTRRARRLRAALLRYGGSRVAIVELPFYLEEPSIEEALEAEDSRTPAPEPGG